MTHLRSAIAAVAIALVSAAPSAAQTSSVSLQPADAPRWDVTGHAAWLGVHRTNAEPAWSNGWFDAGAFGASTGYYWTSHLKLEADVATSTRANFFTVEPVASSGRTIFRSQEHRLTATTAGVNVAYQFFENRWVHPFVAAGVEVARERDRVESNLPPVIGPDGRAPFPLPTVETTTSYAVRPTLGGGFKFYVGEHAFVKTEIRSTVDGTGAATFAWRGGVGIDF